MYWSDLNNTCQTCNFCSQKSACVATGLCFQVSSGSGGNTQTEESGGNNVVIILAAIGIVVVAVIVFAILYKLKFFGKGDNVVLSRSGSDRPLASN